MSSRISRRQPAVAGEAGRAFTLIELMVAMAIMAVLVAIALPAFSAARRSAKGAATSAMISVLATGVEQFKADASIGGQYPPSAQQMVSSPHAANQQIQMGGANFLAWALAGADLLGTPGFRDMNSNKGNTSASQIQLDVIGGCTDDLGRSGLYAIDTSVNKPIYPRSGPYVEVSKVQVTKPKGGGFDVPAAKGQFRMLPSVAFLDAFDQPILYYKANPTAPAMAATGMNAPGMVAGNPENYSTGGSYGSYTPAGVYNLLDNGGHLDGNTSLNGSTAGANITGNESVAGLDLGGGTNHFNQNTLDRASIVGTVNSVTTVSNSMQGSFGRQIWNSNVITVPTAHNASSYILLSAGADGVFGTADDLANFPVNK
jgi:general secretion pathway protein G